MRRLFSAIGFSAGLCCVEAAAQTPALPPLPPVPSSLAPKPAPVVEPPRNLPQGARRAQGPLSLLILLENAADAGDPGVRRIVLREEATSAEYFTRYNGGSLRATLRLKCATGEFQLESLRLYSRNNLSGEVLASLDRRSDWQAAATDTVMRRGLELACGTRPTAAVAARVAPGPAPPRAEAAAPPALRGSLTATPTVAAFDGGLQIGAASTEGGARDILVKLKRAEPGLVAGLTDKVERAVVDGRAVYRAVLTGFKDRQTAVGVCGRLSERGHRCFVRG